jgi:hypothetical protein
MKKTINGVGFDTAQENITVTLDALSSKLVRWYAAENSRDIGDVVNGVIAGELGHLRQETEGEFTDDTHLHIAEYVMEAIHRRGIVEARGFSLGIPSTRHGASSSQTEKAIMHLQDTLARRFGTGFDTDCGAGTLYISHDGVSLTDARSRIVAQRA